MKLNRYYYTVLLAFLAVACTNEVIDQETPVTEETVNEAVVSAVVPGEVNVYFSDEMVAMIEADLSEDRIVTRSAELNSVTGLLGVTSMRRLFPHAGKFEERTRAEGLHKWYVVTFDPTVPQTRAADAFTSISGVEIVEEVRKIRNTAVFNDPKLPSQWHYYNDGSLDKSHKAGADINVVPVWENYTTGNPDVIVAIVDGGIDAAHEDLAANYIGGFNFVRGTSKVVAHSHGTHVAGTVAAVNNNGIGVAGVAGGDAAAGKPGVKLLSCQIFEHNPDDPNRDLAAGGVEAIKWAADNGAVISQNSWGYTYETAEQQEAAVIPSSLKASIDYFIKYAGFDENGKQVGPMAGGVVIFASGNDNRAHEPIGKYEPVISVGAIAPDFSRTYYSNYGDWVDLAAPGGSVEFRNGLVLSTIPGNRYDTMQGTSMACPHVSGVAALVVSHFAGPGFTNTTLRDKLIKGANATAVSKNSKIGKLVDAFGAMTYGGVTPPKPVTAVEASPISNSIFLKWKVTSDPDDKKAYGFTIFASKDRTAVTDVNPSVPSSSVTSVTVMTNDLKVGDEITGLVSGLEFEQDYYVAVAAFDYNKNYSELSDIYRVRTEGNNAPVVQTDRDENYVVKAHESLSAIYSISDPDGHSITVAFTPGSEAAALTQNTDGTYKFAITGNADEHGVYTAVIEVTDSYGLATQHNIRYEILENHPPVIIKDIDDKIFSMPGQKFSLDMSEYLSDPDGEILKFKISITDKTVLHINPAENILHATTLGYGMTDVTIVASDTRGLTCTLTFKVLVKDPEKPLDIYPNPVVDWLNVATMDLEPTHIQIVSSTGKTVYDVTSDVSAFEPARIDMNSYAPGQYMVYVSFGGNEYKRSIVKL